MDRTTLVRLYNICFCVFEYISQVSQCSYLRAQRPNHQTCPDEKLILPSFEMLCSKQENGQLGWSEAIRPSHLEMLISLLVSDNWPILTCWLGLQTYKWVLVMQIINDYKNIVIENSFKSFFRHLTNTLYVMLICILAKLWWNSLQNRSPASTRDSRPTCSEFTWTLPLLPLPLPLKKTKNHSTYCMFVCTGTYISTFHLVS